MIPSRYVLVLHVCRLDPQLGQLTPDRHLQTLSSLAAADRDHALGKAHVLNPELHQLRGPGAGFQQSLQHQPGPPVLSVGLIEKAQFLLTASEIEALPDRTGYLKFASVPAWMKVEFPIYDVALLQTAFVAG